jgi:hypothetical protein
MNRAAVAGMGFRDEDRTTVMSREVLPFPKRRAQADVEERTVVDMPIAAPPPSPIAQIEEQTTIGHAVLPKSAPKLTTPPKAFNRSTLLHGTRPVPPAPPTPAPSRRTMTPPPLVRAGHDSMTMVAAPRSAGHVPSHVPTPPSSATRLHDAPVSSRRDIITDRPSAAPVFVRDAMPSSPAVAPVARVRRDPVLILAACGGMLGTIFTLGIVVGLIVSLRGKPASPSAASAPLAVVAAAPLSITSAPVDVQPAPPVATPAAPVAAKVEAAPAPAAAAAREWVAPPKPAPVHVAQHVSAPAADAPARPAPRPVAVAAAAPAPKATKKRIASPSDPDFDAANAANDLARAQLEASLK